LSALKSYQLSIETLLRAYTNDFWPLISVGGDLSEVDTRYW
jgi:hypothetical protein